ncbi:hypothetical protein ACIQCJ_21595 [Streptomyces sp. NPDC093221]|uniref:hypothetical protein n=1 Tax=Streptomyces sp. NPDC093221 TaxID=3366032 RepID=UPI0037FC7AF2
MAKAPNLSEVNVPTLASAASLSKDTEFPLIGGIRASKTLAIAVNCKGTGTLTVAIEPSGLSFPLRCIPTQVTPTVNEIRFASTSKQAQITFTLSPMSDLAWSYSAGWDPHPAQLDQS